MKNFIFNIDDYCQKLKDNLLSEFGKKLCYMGLQGSYLRGEATEKSDIDIMIILETLTADDMDLYRNILKKCGNSDKACGFICSRADMKNWNPLEICQLKYTTKDLYGTLENFLPDWTLDDEINYIKISLNNLYHALCHGYIFDSSEENENNLLFMYKSAFFILQNTYFLETYKSNNPMFILQKTALTEKLQGDDKAVMDTLKYLSDGGKIDFHNHFSLLFRWCQDKMAEIR